MDANITIREDAYLGRYYDLIGMVYMKNGCCQDRPVLITKSKTGAISAQCACGIWCSNGHRTATAAIKEYERMSQGRGLWDYEKVSDSLKRFEGVIENLDVWLESEEEMRAALCGDEHG